MMVHAASFVRKKARCRFTRAPDLKMHLHERFYGAILRPTSIVPCVEYDLYIDILNATYQLKRFSMVAVSHKKRTKFH